MSMPPKPDFQAMLEVLGNHGVEFIVIGGVSAVLNGAEVATWDLDIVHKRAPDNLPRLLAALEELDAYYREPGDRRLRPKLSHLGGGGHCLFRTSRGDLDVLGSVVGDRVYESLLPHTFTSWVTTTTQARILDLPTLIQIKQATNREKDRAVLPVLEETLAQQRSAQGQATIRPETKDPP